ncbi:MAG: hypothetical protein LBK99_24520 [Opitutaceae bacterium]|jgi:hypothetical protein|nr:hypothetical protein [Opitutaceae bacterium]
MTVLNALGAGTAVTWGADTQPDGDIRSALADAQLASGVYPNRGLMGLVAWNLRRSAYEGGDKAGSFAGLAKTPADVAADLMLGDLRIDKAIFQATKTAKQRIVGSTVYGFLAYDGLSKDDPSHMKQFFTTPLGSAGRFRVFRRQFGPAEKLLEIIIEHYDNILGTSTVGFARLNVSPAT